MDKIREQLEAIAHEAATLTDRRDALVEQARAEKMTWTEIAEILGMTPHGLRKAQARRKDQQ